MHANLFKKVVGPNETSIIIVVDFESWNSSTKCSNTVGVEDSLQLMKVLLVKLSLMPTWM